MKPALPILSLVIAFTACQPTQNVNTNQNTNAAGNQDAIQILPDDEPACAQMAANEVPGGITINPADAQGADIGPVNDITIKSGVDKVVWCVENKTTFPVVVLIHNLREKMNPAVQNPFGNGAWRDNYFVTKIIRPGRVKNIKTKVAYKSGTYKYDILVLDYDGDPLDFEDPQVVISDGLPGVKPDNRNATSGNSNAANRNRR